MNDSTFTVKDMLDVQFKTLDAKLDDIKHTLKDQNVNAELRFSRIEREIDDIKTAQTKVMTVWGILSAVGATVFAFILNRLL